MQVLGRFVSPNVTPAPASPSKGEMYFDTADNTLKWWDGTQWVAASGSGGSTATIEPWHVVGQPGEPPLLNSFKSYGYNGDASQSVEAAPGVIASLAFRRDPFGHVKLRGMAYTVALGASTYYPIFTLPAGFRPPKFLHFGVQLTLAANAVADSRRPERPGRALLHGCAWRRQLR